MFNSEKPGLLQQTTKRICLHESFLADERGEMVGTIGWMALIATFLVMIHGLVSGWLPGFVNRIFSRMDTLV